MDNIKVCLEIRKIGDGGYLVADARCREPSLRDMLLASSTIDEALKYIKASMEPKK